MTLKQRIELPELRLGGVAIAAASAYVCDLRIAHVKDASGMLGKPIAYMRGQRCAPAVVSLSSSLLSEL